MTEDFDFDFDNESIVLDEEFFDVESEDWVEEIFGSDEEIIKQLINY